MENRIKLAEKLEQMKAKFMTLESDEERLAYTKDMEDFVSSYNEEERKVLGEIFLEGANQACQSAENLYDDVLRNHLEDIYDVVSWSYIARYYFGKSRSWICQRVNGLRIHDKMVQFTSDEKKILFTALQDLSNRIKNTAQVIEQL